MIHSLPLLLLCACAHADIRPEPEDIQCGQVGTVDVRLRSGVPPLLECGEARSVAVNTLGQRWTLLFTRYFTGMDVGLDMLARYPDGMTYPAKRLMVVRADRPWVARHELGHAFDVEHGLPNGRDE